MKISIISRTFRVHDNPFLDSDLYIIYIDKKEYGTHQKKFLDRILYFHTIDLKNININFVIKSDLNHIKKIQEKYNAQIYVDYLYPNYKYNFDVIYEPSWCLINWVPSEDSNRNNLIRKWFLPEALKNHKIFKEYVHKNIRELYKVQVNKSKINYLKSNYKINFTPNTDEYKGGLDKWILKQLEKTKFMKSGKWYKPNTNGLATIDTTIKSNLSKTSKLSPYIALGVLSPLKAYKFWNGENRMGSGRDQILFREMFHACAQLPEFWKDNFGQGYKWKSLDKKKWGDILKANTKYADLDWALSELYRTGWIHHLARHIIADYITRGKLEFHWKHGESLFQKFLLDHDKCVNRANWMWLSGTAFSSKQRSFFHYNYDNYLTNRCRKNNN